MDRLNRIRMRLIGKLLRRARLKADLTQKQVSEELGYSTAQFISNWERGISLPPNDALPILAKLYRLSPQQIIRAFEQYRLQELNIEQEHLKEVLKRRA